MKRYSLILLFFITLFCNCINQKPNRSNNSISGLDSISFNNYWTVEAVNKLSNGVKFFSDTVEINAEGGFTLWRNEKYTGKIEISYKACVMYQGFPDDRLSDLNCFWMATDPQNTDDIFERSKWRNGVFENYYSLQMYYLGYGGNDNTTTRFRRYDGDYKSFINKKIKPKIITEYNDPAHLLQPNHWYNIRIKCDKQSIKYFIDGKLLINFKDPNPFTSGWFGFRTTKARVRLTQFTVK